MSPFERDMDFLLNKLSEGEDAETRRMLTGLKNRLVHLRERNLVKISHSVMELVCAKYLLLKGYEVNLEQPLTEKLICDVYATKGDGTMIVEIETGYVPPENALDPLAYWKARIASKISRYSVHSNRFGLGTPPHCILQIPRIFLTPPRERSQKELSEIKNNCDKYYHNPPLSFDDLRYGYLHVVNVIDVDAGEVREFDPIFYSEKCYWI